MIKQYRICYLSTDFANACSFINSRVLGLYDIFSGSTLQRENPNGCSLTVTFRPFHTKTRLKSLSPSKFVIPKKKIMLYLPSMVTQNKKSKSVFHLQMKKRVQVR